MEQLWNAVARKSREIKRQGEWSNWNDFYSQMPTILDADFFLGISLI